MSKTASPLSALRRMLGEYRGPTQTGYYNFCHKECGDTRFRFGVNLATRKWFCFNCNRRGVFKRGELPESSRWTLPLELRERGVAAREARQGRWEPILSSPRKRRLEERAVAYLESRGISRARAAAIGLGFGTEPQIAGAPVFPWFDDRGFVGGYQIRFPFEPESGPKVLTFTDGMGIRDGALLGYERIPPNAPLAITEGPFDQASMERVMPAVGLLGSVLHEAQSARLQRLDPPHVVIATDPDTFERQNDEPPKMRAILARLWRDFDCPLLVVRYPEGFGDLGGRPDKTPHTREEIERLVLSAEPASPGYL